MTWLWIVVAWIVLAAPWAVLLGRSIRLADRREAEARRAGFVPEVLPPQPRVQPCAAYDVRRVARGRRRGPALHPCPGQGAQECEQV